MYLIVRVNVLSLISMCRMRLIWTIRNKFSRLTHLLVYQSINGCSLTSKIGCRDILYFMLFKDLPLFIYDFGICCFSLTLRIISRLLFIMVHSFCSYSVINIEIYCDSDLVNIGDYIFSEFCINYQLLVRLLC